MILKLKENSKHCLPHPIVHDFKKNLKQIFNKPNVT